ncbi:AAR086Wp [Eremothecium gossypii ATCC 10895]|uniref:AAR086Wp n=1 Tax=Eremothecium gossypii (strain ATCC 10895 / CBS 109.51 / FGSC 9923 / NRRL Y-1056) TaxID=284811 RepID=Q75EJ3_EREGS|nr:AAR086Wp [Eremothecium gossypii ATCC 10895]AAS50451.1 AAR086Wp [Eremothecium gossypii ATCC 10895]AEY94737.1 FAAR086Wp [Eremothecium gossypii FDAG1]
MQLDAIEDAESGSSSDDDYLLELADVTEFEGVLPKDHYSSPFYVDVPVPQSLGDHRHLGDDTQSYVREYPTSILADRFDKWRKLLKSLVAYLREVAAAQEQHARINAHLKSAVKFSFLADLEEGTNKVVEQLKRPSSPSQSGAESAQDSYFQVQEGCSNGFLRYGSGSIQDLQVSLKKYHMTVSNQQLKASRELNNVVIPKLEELRRNLSSKIKEIKELSNDFKTNIHEQVALTGQLLQKYIASVDLLSTAEDSTSSKSTGQRLKPKHDPYLLKLQLDLQLKRQLLEENYLQEAYINLQTSGMELEKIVYGQIQTALQKFAHYMDIESCAAINGICQELRRGILSKPTTIEWDDFVGLHPTCLLNWKSSDPVPPPRRLSDIRYPKMKSPMAKCIRAGYLMKKSKLLKNYNKGYFVLTSNYLHEFKSSDFFKMANNGEKPSLKKINFDPLGSIPLNESTVTEALPQKFVLCSTWAGIDSQEAGLSATSSGTSFTSMQGSRSSVSLGKLLKGAAKPGKALTSAKASTSEITKGHVWTFKPSTTQSEKDFKKWCGELRQLAGFNSTLERCRYIEEKIVKAHSRASSKASQSSIGTPPEGPGRAQKPQFIDIKGLSPIGYNIASPINTPAFDDNGNLIMAGDRNMSLLTPSGLSFQGAPSLTNTISSDGTSLQSRSPTPVDTAATFTEGNLNAVQPGVGQSGGGGSISSPRSTESINNSGGYFAIPVNRSQPQRDSVPSSQSRADRAPPSGSVPLLRVTSQSGNVEQPGRPSLYKQTSSPSLTSIKSRQTQLVLKHKRNLSFQSLAEMVSK